MKTLARWKNVANRGRNMIFADQEYSPTAGTSLAEGIPSLAMYCDPAVAFEMREDFLAIPLDDTTANPTEWAYVSDTAAGAVTFPAGLVGGVVNLATGGVDNNETYIQYGLPTCEPFKITNASDKAVWFEARIKSLQHADEGVFIGLAEAGAITGGNFLVDNTGVPADKDYIGFRYKCDASAEWDVAWKKAGQAEQEIAAAAVNADDWHTFGFYFDGESTVTFYIDRVASATVATTSAATFPSGEELSPVIAVKTGAGAARNIQVDYIRVVQAR